MSIQRLPLLALLVLAAACSKPKPNPPPTGTTNLHGANVPVRSNMTAFTSEGEMKQYFDKLAEELKTNRNRVTAGGNASPPAPAAAEAAASTSADGDAKAESITNTQHAGVDEGGIVKTHGDHLVILRRGRLFTVKVAGDDLTPVASADAYGPDIDPMGTWYDEMLVAGDTAIVIGYSYQRGGTEIGLFDLDKQGGIKYRATHHLRSNDYYSSRNYASRVIGDKLIFYTPSYLSLGNRDPMASFPAVRRWHKGATNDEFKRIVEPTQVYRPVTGFTSRAMHTVTVCDLSKQDMPCKGTAVLGPAGRVFYVSGEAVYVWATDWKYENKKSTQKSMVVRLPLDGAGPSAMKVSGAPVDQFSFLEKDGHLNVVVRSQANGDAMWSPEATAGDVAMLRVPVGIFSEQIADIPAPRYTKLPKPAGYTFQNRFVGDHLIYGTGSSWGYAQPKQENKLFVHRFAGSDPARELPLPHPADRIEAMGKNAVVVGGDGKDLHFTAVALGTEPRLAGHYSRSGASQGETRSHGFFYKPDAEAQAESGVIGLPIMSSSKPGYRQLFNGSASVVFVKNEALDLRLIGELESGSQEGGANDGCKASCVDWYGNARPIFLGGRAFALMGYEIVEGKMEPGRISERRRVSFAPQKRL